MMSAIAMTLMLVASLSCFAYLMIPRTKVLLNLQPDARFDQVGERIKSVVKFAIGQWRMPREPIAGFAHIMIFSGFMVVALGTVLHIAHAYAGELVDSFYLRPDLENFMPSSRTSLSSWSSSVLVTEFGVDSSQHPRGLVAPPKVSSSCS